jgi:hypothetical protein
MKQQHDKKHCEVTFQEGDWVWLRLHHRTAVGITPQVVEAISTFL